MSIYEMHGTRKQFPCSRGPLHHFGVCFDYEGGENARNNVSYI